MLSSKGCVLSKENMSNKEIEKIKLDLYVKPLNIAGNTESSNFAVYRESPNHYRVPRFYGTTRFNVTINFKNEEKINLKFNGILKESLEQHIAVQKSIDTLCDVGGGILSLPTGYGKTTCALAILSQLSVKTIIIVHKEFLMNQWIERIKQFLPDATIGIIRQNKCETNKDVTIAMLQTLCIKEFDKGLFKNYGLTIIDEAHHICSRVFSKALFKINTKYILGLSATPDRKDGLTQVLKWFLGDLILNIKRKNQSQVNIEKVDFNCDAYNSPVPLNITGKVNLPGIISTLVTLEDRNSLIIKLIIDNLLINRKIILLSERRIHCEFFLKNVPTLPNKSYGLYIGGMKQDTLKQNEKCDLILATYSLAHEGLDIPSLDTLILATPKGDVVQSCGRILRETVGKKHNPLIFDIVDSWGPLQNQFKKRKSFYNKSGFNLNSNINSEHPEHHTKLSSFSFIDDL